MKRILICILLITNLFSGLAFAWDTHPEALAGHDTVMLHALASIDHDHTDGIQHHGDHCCHGAAHLIGLFNVDTMPVALTISDHDTFLLFALTSLHIPTLHRPPIV